MKNDVKIKNELIYRFKIDMRNLMNFDPSTWNSKKMLFNGLLLRKHKIIELKKYRRLMFHDIEELMQKLKRNWLSRFKTDMRNLTNFDSSTQKSKKLEHFNRLLLNKLYNIWAEETQKSCVCLHWRLIQTLKENWLVLSKMRRETW